MPGEAPVLRPGNRMVLKTAPLPQVQDKGLQLEVVDVPHLGAGPMGDKEPLQVLDTAADDSDVVPALALAGSAQGIVRKQPADLRAGI